MGKLYHLTKEILRLLARNAIGNSLRVFLFRASGVVIAKNVSTGQGIMITDNGKKGMVIFEEYTNISLGTSLITNATPLCIHPSLAKEDLPLEEGRIRVREGAWIGANATILPGITIGKCSIVGAGAVVTKDVPDYTIVAGVPAREIRKIR